MAFSVDVKRFDKCIDHLARGIYFHDYQEKWTGSTKQLRPSLVALDRETNEKAVAVNSWNQESD